jgi:Zn-dependent protease/cell wall assembly regulator SMI1
VSQLVILVLTIIAVVQVLRLRAYLAKQFPTLRARPLPVEACVPAGFADLFEAAHGELSALGFERAQGFLIDADPAEAALVRFQLVYVKPADGAVFVLFPGTDLSAPHRLGTYCATRLGDGRLVITQANDPYFEVTATDAFPAQTVAAPTFRVHWEAHRGFVAGFDADIDPTFTEPAQLLDFAAEALNRKRDLLVERGRLWRDSAGVVRATPRFALSIMLRVYRRPKAPKSSAPVPAARLAFLASVVERVRNTTPPRAAQLALFGVSAAAFALLGVIFWDVRFAVLLLIVIFIHEAGHYLAMRAFGYRNVHMLALPLVGGVTMGHETRPSAARSAWMSLMGPLPGIVIGWSLLFVGTAFPAVAAMMPWASEAAWIFLAVNYLNVLPVPPLDGGQIVQAMLPPRWYVAQAAFVGSACVIGAIGAVASGYAGLALIAVLQLVTLPLVLQNGRALRALTKLGVPALTQPRIARVRRVLEVLEQTAGPTSEATRRIGQAEAVLRAADQAPMPWWHRGLLAVVLAALLVVPVGGALFFLAMSSQFNTKAAVEASERFEHEHEALQAQALAMTIPQLAAAIGEAPHTPAAESALVDAERRLGRSLPSELAAIYSATDGAPEIHLAPAADLALADPAELATIARDNAIEVEVARTERLEQQRLPLARAHSFIRIGREESEKFSWYYDADAEPALSGLRVYEIGEYGARGFTDLRSMLVDIWTAERLSELGSARRKAAGKRIRAELGSAPIERLAEELDRPSIFERLVAGVSAWPDGADAATIAATSRRLGAPLPDDIIALYRAHDGFPPLQLWPLAEFTPYDASASDVAEGREIIAAQLGREFELGAGSGDLSSVRIDSTALNDCFVVGGWKPHARSEEHARAAQPNVLWCPRNSDPMRWITLTRARVYPSLREYVLDVVAERKALLE